MARTPHGAWVLLATIVGSSMASIDGTVVNVALPALQTSLHATAAQVQWVVEAYALLLAALLMPGGSLGDLYGRRKIFLAGVLLFALASMACGLAPSILYLILARALQGVGAALLVPGSLSLISACFTAEERGRAIGTWSGFTAITTAIGPVFGGWLVQHLSWRWVFFINLPLAAVVVAAALYRVPESRNPGARKLDLPGATLATFGLAAVTYSLIEAHGAGPGKWLCGLAGVVLLLCFGLVEARSPEPMVSLALFRSADFSAANLLTFLLYAALSGLLFFFPLNLIQVQGYTPTHAGASLLPMIVLIFLLSRWSGGLVARFGARWPLTLGSLVCAAGFALFLLPGVGGSYWTTFFPAVLVLGLGLAICVSPLTTTVMESAPGSDAGIASGVNNAISRIAGLLAIAVFGLVLTAEFNSVLSMRLDNMSLAPAARQQVDRDRPLLAGIQTNNAAVKGAIDQAFVAGYRRVIWMAVILALLSAASAQRIQRRKQTNMQPAQPHAS